MLIEFPYRILKIVKQAVVSATHGTPAFYSRPLEKLNKLPSLMQKNPKNIRAKRIFPFDPSVNSPY
jgi:hypothetical protein